MVVAHLPVQRHDDQGQNQLVHNARAQECHVPEVLRRAPLRTSTAERVKDMLNKLHNATGCAATAPLMLMLRRSHDS